MPGTSVGSFGMTSSSPINSSIFVARLPRLSRCPMIEKLGRTRRLFEFELPLAKIFVGEVDGESVFAMELPKISAEDRGDGIVILEGGMAVIALAPDNYP